VLSVQFEPLTALRAAHFGLLWDRFRTDFPKTQEHAPLERAVEEFGVRPSFGIGLRLELVDKPPVTRCWFLNDAETMLIQVQRDRLIVNWRKGAGEQPYPHFDSVLDLFVRAYSEFDQFIQREQLGQLVPDQCEVTYIDHITGGGVWERHGQLDRVLAAWSSVKHDDFPLDLENARLALQYIIPGDSNEPVGRLHVHVQPANRRSDDAPIIVMNTTARGRPLGDGLDGVRRFFVTGRAWAVRAFVALTSPEMQQIWEKRDG
jgi:uncharacterized protein (TIGR04255 family)